MMLTEVISSIGEAGLAAVTGYAVVFFGIILLMAVVSIMGKICLLYTSPSPRD